MRLQLNNSTRGEYARRARTQSITRMQTANSKQRFDRHENRRQPRPQGGTAQEPAFLAACVLAGQADGQSRCSDVGTLVWLGYDTKQRARSGTVRNRKIQQ